MFARIARYEVNPGKVDETVEGFREAAAGLADLDGFESGYVLVDRDSGGFATVTLWGTRQAMESSRMRAGTLRREAVRAADGQVVSVSEYEIAFDMPTT
jgi:heme-degrading monooxygenase HmoA